MFLKFDVALDRILGYVSDAFAEIGLAPEDGCSPPPAQPGEESQQFVGCIPLELRGQPGRLRDLPCNDEYAHVVGHGLHLSDPDAE